MKPMKVGVFGLGIRGASLLPHVLDVEGVQVTALCDLYEERIERALKHFTDRDLPLPTLCTADYHELIASDDVDVVMVFAA